MNDISLFEKMALLSNPVMTPEKLIIMSQIDDDSNDRHERKNDEKWQSETRQEPIGRC